MDKSRIHKIYGFGNFHLDAAHRLLYKNGREISLTPKVVETLLALVEHSGEVLSKDELMDIIWADSFVEEGNLTQNLYLLRKILQKKTDGTPFIETLKRRGYRFNADVSSIDAHAPNQIPADEIQFSVIENNKNQTAENLPQLVGREKEISQIKNLLLQADVRLVTLAGISGTGKTRLAQKLAQDLAADFPDGVFFVDLAAITNSELVAQTIARTLGIKDAGDEAVLENIKNFLRDKQILLVIDNFEQVIDAAPDIAELVADNLKILITSRRLLNLSAEREFIVPPLALPDADSNVSPDELSKYEAIELFVRRARKIKPNFALTKENADAVAEICRRLDGLPLAIELAVARIKIFSLSAILERLENQLNLLTGGAKDLPERQQTMRGTVRWSYDLLDENEKILFQTLSVFAGSFTVEAAEAVAKEEEEKDKSLLNISASETAAPDIEIFDGISSLLDKSLIFRTDQKDGESRFRMLEVVREYALELFEKNDEAEVVRRKHADYFLQLGEAAEPHLLGADSIKWLDRLETEHDNLREALGWLLENDVITAARLAGAIYFFWNIHSHQTEARQWMETILRQSEQITAEMRLKLISQLGSLARAQGDHEAAIKFFGQALELGRVANNLPQMARSTRGLGLTTFHLGDYKAARKFLEEGLAISRQLDDLAGIAPALNILGDLTRTEGDDAAARPLIEESLAIYVKLGNKQGICANNINLATIAYTEDDFETMRFRLTQALTTAQELGEKIYISCCFDSFASLALKDKQLKRAARLAGAAENLRESFGYEIEPAERRLRDAYLAELESKTTAADFAEFYEQGRKLKLEEAVALCLEESVEWSNSSTNVAAKSVQTSKNLSPIIGREDEILQIKNLLSNSDVRLLTLAGVGGAGKTRLAHAVIEEMSGNFADGAFFVEMEAISNPALVASTIAKTFGIKETGDESGFANLKNYLADKQMLLVIDNFEQIIEAAPIIAEFVADAEYLKMLITSRTLLNLSAEKEFIVPPLDLPEKDSNISVDKLAKYEAVELFVESARKNKPNFALTKENAANVAEICRRLDGLPLAIELAAARIKILSPQMILTKLENCLKFLTGGARDLPARQQTMRGAVEWSFDLLSENEKILFRRLSVFVGGFTIESAEAVCLVDKINEVQKPKPKDQFEILDLITSLTDKNLLVSKEQTSGESRFMMLEVVREYASESLEASNETEKMRRTHAEYFLALGEEAESHLQGAESVKWLNLLENEHDNLREVIAWSLDNSPELAVSLLVAIRIYLTNHCHLTEGREWLNAALERSDAAPARVRFRLLNGLGWLAVVQGDYQTARKMYEKSLAEGRTVSDKKRIAESLRGLGAATHSQGDYAAARKFHEEGLAIHRELNDKIGIASSLNGLGYLALDECDNTTARRFLEESLTIFRQLGNESGVCYCLLNLGAVANINSDYEAAQEYYVEALTIAQHSGYKDRISFCFDGFAELAAKRGEQELAARLAGTAEYLRETIGFEIELAERRFRDTYLTELKIQMDKTAFSKFYEQGRKLDLEEAVALCLEETEEIAAPHNSESANSESNFSNSANVFEICQMARMYFQQSTMPTYIKARELLEEAIRLDADYAPAYVALSELCIKEAIYNLSPLAEGFEGAKNAIERAAELNSDSAEFYAAKGFVALVADWNFDEATRNLHKSLAINPQCAFANNYLGQVFMFRCEFDEAEMYLRRAVKIEPAGLYNHGMLMIAYFLARKYKKSLEAIEKYSAINPQSVAAEQILCWNLEQTGRVAEAITKYEKHLGEPHGAYFKRCLGYAYAHIGNKKNARKILNELVAESREHYLSPIHSAMIYAELNEKDEAILHLESALAYRDPWMLWLAADPRFDNLRMDERFQKLEKAVASKAAYKNFAQAKY